MRKKKRGTTFGVIKNLHVDLDKNRQMYELSGPGYYYWAAVKELSQGMGENKEQSIAMIEETIRLLGIELWRLKNGTNETAEKV